MADFGLIKPAFWSVEQRNWSDAERALGAYLLSCRHRNLEGLYELPLGYVVTDLNWDQTKTEETLQSLIGRRFCDYDDAAEVVFVCKSLKHLAPKGIPRIKGAVRAIEKVPPTHLMGPFYEACLRYAPDLWKALGQPTKDGGDTPSIPPQGGSDDLSNTPTSGYSEAERPEADTKPDVDTETDPEAAAAREHTREGLRIETALGVLAKRHGVEAPSVSEIDAVLADYPDRDHDKALDEIKRWAARAPGSCPSRLRDAFRSELAKARVLPVGKRPVVVSISPATADDAEQWAKAREHLQANVREDVFDIWLATLTLVGVSAEGALVLESAQADWIRQRYDVLITGALDGRQVQIIEAEGEVAA